MLLSSVIKNLIKKADHLALRFEPLASVESWERDKKVVTLEITRRPAKGKGDGDRIRFDGFQGRISNGHRDELEWYEPSDGFNRYQIPTRTESNVYAPASGCWSALYCGHDHHLQNVFRTIPTGSALTFRMHLDLHTNCALNAKNIHADVLTVEATPPARRNGKTPAPIVFTLAVEVGPHNTARFGNPRN